MDEARQVEHLYELQREVEPDRELLEAPLKTTTTKTGQEQTSANLQVALFLEGDIYCYFKPMNGVDAPAADFFKHTVVSATLAECAAWRLASAMGGVLSEIVIPQVLRKFESIDSRAPGALARRYEGKTNSSNPFTEVREECVAAAFFDSLIGQQDRNKANWLWDKKEGRFRLLDHGFAFGRPGDETLSLRFTKWRWDQHGEALLDDEMKALARLLGSDDLFGLRRFFDDDRCDALESRARQMLEDKRLMPLAEL
jgi:hypothetical protein